MATVLKFRLITTNSHCFKNQPCPLHASLSDIPVRPFQAFIRYINAYNHLLMCQELIAHSVTCQSPLYNKIPLYNNHIEASITTKLILAYS